MHTRTHMLTAGLLYHLIGKRYSCTRMLSAGLTESCFVIFSIKALAPSSDINQLRPGQYMLSTRLLIKKNIMSERHTHTYRDAHMLTAGFLS